jgi:hypothetical protein
MQDRAGLRVRPFALEGWNPGDQENWKPSFHQPVEKPIACHGIPQIFQRLA